MSIVQCRECGEEIDGDAAVRLDRCPGCQAPVRIRSKKRRKSRESTESTAESAARARVIVGISAAAGLVVIGAGFAGLLWWLVSSRMAASVAAAEARLQGTVTVLPARKARLPQKPKALVVRGELQTPAQGADRDALTKTFADFLDRLGVDCDPNAREPVMRLRAVGPNMMNVKMLKPHEARNSRGTLNAAVCTTGYLDVVDANGQDIIDRSDFSDPVAAAKLVDSYVVVKQTEWDKDTDKPEKWPDAVAKAWKELPGMIRGNRLDILSNPTYNKTLISALAKYQR